MISAYLNKKKYKFFRLFVSPIINHEPLDRFDSNFVQEIYKKSVYNENKITYEKDIKFYEIKMLLIPENVTKRSSNSRYHDTNIECTIEKIYNLLF